MRIPSGYLYYDTPIGILCLDTLFPKPPGQLRNPLTFDFPVVCRVLRGVGAKEILSSTSAQLETLFVDAARELERDGVKAIAGSCGFMALFQKAVASAVSVPVLMSSLVQIPLIHTLHGPGCRIGVLTAHSGSLTPEHFRQAGVPDAQIDALAIAGMENFPVFRKTILEGAAPVMATDAVENGAEEVDMVINLGWVKDQKWDDLLAEIKAVKAACKGRLLKVIIECCFLTDEEKIKMCEIVTASGAEYIKTSTGFSTGGATREDVALLRENLPKQVKLKASGGIRTLADGEAYLALGADRLGASALVGEARKQG